MEHSVQEYLRRLPTETLEQFLQDYTANRLTEDFRCVIDDVVKELHRRKNEQAAL